MKAHTDEEKSINIVMCAIALSEGKLSDKTINFLTVKTNITPDSELEYWLRNEIMFVALYILWKKAKISIVSERQEEFYKVFRDSFFGVIDYLVKKTPLSREIKTITDPLTGRSIDWPTLTSNTSSNIAEIKEVYDKRFKFYSEYRGDLSEAFKKRLAMMLNAIKSNKIKFANNFYQKTVLKFRNKPITRWNGNVFSDDLLNELAKMIIDPCMKIDSETLADQSEESANKYIDSILA